MPATRPLIDRILEKIVKSSDNCWEWTSALDSHGYAVISKNNKAAKAYREIYKLLVGDIPDNMCVLHKCDNRKCVNPDHLFLGTKADNLHDMWNKGRANASGPPRKISEWTAKEAKRLYNSGIYYLDICSTLCIRPGSFYNILKRVPK
jgi:hypothetical protein